MIKRNFPMALSLVLMLAAPQNLFAAGDLTQQTPEEVRVELGAKDSNEHRFHPSDLTFETGKLYRLVLHNPSKAKHYFTSLEFANRVYTRKVQVMDKSGADRKPLAEIKGAIREIEVYPGGTTEWWFVPVATGKLTDLHCHVKDDDGHTHEQKGMTGTITIK